MRQGLVIVACMGALLWGTCHAGMAVVALHHHLHHSPEHDHGTALETALHGHAHEVGAEEHDHRLGTAPSATRAPVTRSAPLLPAAVSPGDRGPRLARRPGESRTTGLRHPPPPFLLHGALLI